VEVVIHKHVFKIAWLVAAEMHRFIYQAVVHAAIVQLFMNFMENGEETIPIINQTPLHQFTDNWSRN
jgi:hypothetical protein